MAFKINISHKGKTAKFEIESEELVGKSIGDKIDGEVVNQNLKGYELEITGTSDKAGFPGLPDLAGPNLQGALLTYGRGMKKRPKGDRKKSDKPKGLRLRKSVRGKEISTDIVQINMKVLKEGGKGFDELLPKKEEAEEKPAEGEKKEEIKGKEKVEGKREEDGGVEKKGGGEGEKVEEKPAEEKPKAEGGEEKPKEGEESK